MILQALCAYYDALARRGDVTPPGWSVANVSYALEIGENGALRGVIPLKQKRDGSAKELPQSMQVPEQLKRSGSNAPPYFLCDNAQYFLGLEKGIATEKALRCFQSCKEIHLEILSGCDCKEARAVCNFFRNWDPEKASSCPELHSWYGNPENGNFVFAIDGQFVHKAKEIKDAWESHKKTSSVIGRCMISGEIMPIARIHNSVKGIYSDTPAPNGWTLIGVDKEAFESYGKTQGFNSPISEKAAFAYTAALNHLLRDRSHVQRFGDCTVIYWAEDADPLCQDLITLALFGGPSDIVTDEDLRSAMRAISHGNPVDPDRLSGRFQNRFYVLGLAPNAARLSVKFFLQSTFGDFLTNIAAHYKRLEVVKPANEKEAFLSIRELVEETIRPKNRVKQTDSAMTCAVFRSVLQNSRYPDSLCANILLRINAERQVTWKKVAILKAWLIQNCRMVQYEEEQIMPIQYERQTPAFLLGCMFALLEKIQQDAIENINRTLVDKYISTASATPARVFDGLLEKSHYHLRKKNDKYHRGEDLKKLLAVYHEKSPTIPERHSHQERADFMIGYYLKQQELWTSKKELKKTEEKENV